MEKGNTGDQLCVGCTPLGGLTRGDAGIVSVYLEDQLTNNTNMAVDGSITPVVYKYNPPSNAFAYLTDINYVMFNGPQGFTPEKFASRTALPNGIIIKFNGLDWVRIKTNRDIEILSNYMKPQLGTTTLPPTKLSGNFDFVKIGNGLPVQIFPPNGIEVIIQDDIELVGLELYMMAMGIERLTKV